MAEEKQKYYCTVIDPKRRNGAFVDGSKQRNAQVFAGAERRGSWSLSPLLGRLQDGTRAVEVVESSNEAGLFLATRGIN